MALPADVATITVTGTYTDWQGNPCAGTVTFTPDVCRLVDTADNVLIAGGRIAPLDTSGHIAVQLVASRQDTIAPYDFTYTVTEETDCLGCSRTYKIAIPADGGNLDLSDVLNTD